MLFPDDTLADFYPLSDLSAQQMFIASLVAMRTVYAIGRLAFGGWQDDVESSGEGWRSEGFIRHDNRLPQRFVVQLVEFAPQPRLTRHVVEPGQELQWTISGMGGDIDRALLIVSAIAPVTTERAAYRFEIR